MTNADILRDPSNVRLQVRRVIQTREGLPDSDPDILCEVVDGVRMPFVDTRNAPHHPGMGLDYLFQLHHAGDDSAFSKCILPLYVIVAPDDAILQKKRGVLW